MPYGYQIIAQIWRECTEAHRWRFFIRCRNIKTKKVIVARDPIGVMPLYWSNNAISSLLTCLRGVGPARQVPPGHVAEFTIGDTPTFRKWTADYVRAEPIIDLKTVMTSAVKKRLMGDVPWVFFLQEASTPL